MKVLNNLLLLLYITIISCNKESKINLEDNNYRHFQVNKQEWQSPKYTQKLNEINYTVAEVPLEYYILKEAGNNKEITDSILNANKLERIIEFEFIQDDSKELLSEEFTKMNYDESLKYLSFNIQNDFYLVNSKNDTIQCSGVIVERNYKIKPCQKILLFFSGVEAQENIQLIYNDQLFGKGIMKFKISDNSTNLIL